LFDLRIAAAERSQDRKLVRGRLVLEISMDQPVVGPGLIGLVGDQHRWIDALGEGVGAGDRFRLRAAAGNRNAPAHLT